MYVIVYRRTCKILVEIEFPEDSTLLSGEVLKPEMRSLVLKLSEQVTLKMSFGHLQDRVESLGVTIKQKCILKTMYIVSYRLLRISVKWFSDCYMKYIIRFLKLFEFNFEPDENSFGWRKQDVNE